MKSILANSSYILQQRKFQSCKCFSQIFSNYVLKPLSKFYFSLLTISSPFYFHLFCPLSHWTNSKTILIYYIQMIIYISNQTIWIKINSNSKMTFCLQVTASQIFKCTSFCNSLALSESFVTDDICDQHFTYQVLFSTIVNFALQKF